MTHNHPELGHPIVRHRRSTNASDELSANVTQSLQPDRGACVNFCVKEEQVKRPTVNR